jgi:hypothetical protein
LLVGKSVAAILAVDAGAVPINFRGWWRQNDADLNFPLSKLIFPHPTQTEPAGYLSSTFKETESKGQPVIQPK